MRLTSRALLSLILAVSFTGYMFAAPAAGPVLASASGAVVNAARVVNGASLHVGDEIATAANGSALLTLGEARVNFGELTSAQLEAGALRLAHGYLRVNGALSIEQTHITAMPAAHSDYEMMELASGRTYLRVYKGSVTLSGLGKSVTVPAGAAVSYDANASANASGAQAQEAGLFGLGTWGTALVVVGTAVAVTAGGIAIANTNNPPSSPTQP